VTKVLRQKTKKRIFDNILHKGDCTTLFFYWNKKDEKDMKKINSNNQAMFIKTQDINTCEELKRAGFDLIDYTDNTWTFMNKPDCTLVFEDNKIVYSNKLCI